MYEFYLARRQDNTFFFYGKLNQVFVIILISPLLSLDKLVHNIV